MAYVPPHRRHSKEPEMPLLTPELLAPQFKKNLNVKPYYKSKVDENIVYAHHSTHGWCAIPLDDENQFPSSVNLEPVTLESAELNVGENHLALINTGLDNEGGEVKWNLPRSPWESITENVLEDLLLAFKHARSEMKSAKPKEAYPTLIARVGKVLFRRSPSVNMESIRKNLCAEIPRQWRQLFYTNTPVSYKEKIVNEVVPKIGVDFEEEEDIYDVQLSDSTSPDSTLFCRCLVMKEHGKLQLCENDEMQSITDLINSAILDPDLKGGLRWPPGKESSGDKYRVVRFTHVIVNTYRNTSLRLKVKHYDRFDLRTLTGEASWGISLMLENVVSKLQEENVEASTISEILKEDMQLIWDNFLSCERFLS
ncbi:uncharacterized protein LOC103941622 isoform X4 [Pyrus x bretschneideri]|uniref:uncharacterized protein LOC103941622 isoform X4 n=1 Tax=Pyrus x bretschneideri TaxID=225117 RepID=UPI00202E5413|nr:uncharacterized protein LOC103941622 isoform X4 [Pyrus x bretschneideri]